MIGPGYKNISLATISRMALIDIPAAHVRIFCDEVCANTDFERTVPASRASRRKGWVALIGSWLSPAATAADKQGVQPRVETKPASVGFRSQELEYCRAQRSSPHLRNYNCFQMRMR
mmetsp:Transcript_56271/g.129194  ORF Transcript_56271/g.129194 Transcript_56271/m.129194 type:complete len:117 (-) Transcript_56271:1221-1571(-)